MTVGAAVPTLLVLFTLGVPQPLGEPQATSEHLESLVEAEREFSRRAGQVGVSGAFLEVLAQDGLVFNPGPVNARELHSENPWPAEYSLEWHPRVAGVSAGGDLGYTSGPYVFRAGPDAEASYGHYFSVWRRPEPDGPWKLVLDIGTPHRRLEDQDQRPAVREFPTPPEQPPSWSRDRALEQLRRTSGELRDRLDRRGAGPDPAELVLENVRVYRTGRIPAVGAGALVERRSSAEGRSRTVQGTHLAGSLDMAFVWGEYRDRDGDRSETGSFLELWVGRDGGWRLAAGVMHVHPGD